MFIRRKKNKLKTTSVYIPKKENEKQILVKSLEVAINELRLNKLKDKARQEISKITKQINSKFDYKGDGNQYLKFTKEKIDYIKIAGTELVLNKVFNEVGFNQLPEELLRYLVISKVVYPGNKLRTIECLSRYHQKHYTCSQDYRYKDKLDKSHKNFLQRICYNHIIKLLNGIISVVFYGEITLYFKTSREDELREAECSKDWKSHNLLIVLGILFLKARYLLGNEMYKENQYEDYTLIPILNKFKSTFKVDNLIGVAGTSLISKTNVEYNIYSDCEFILGARI